jgi:hypothetical protein
MTIKTSLAALALIVIPATSFALGCSSGKAQEAMSCAPGTAWDATLQTCVEQVSS